MDSILREPIMLQSRQVVYRPSREVCIGPGTSWINLGALLRPVFPIVPGRDRSPT
jgi:hypothetical protein